VERDVLAHMAFRPRVARQLARMDARLFRPEPMGLEQDMARAAQHTREPRRRLT
jgi:propionate CoA-transferase